MIQKEIRDERTGEMIQLDHNDPRYWDGPYKYEPYPKMVFRVTQPGQKDAEAQIVRSQREHDALPSDWKESPADAREHFERVEAEIAKAAAESNYADRNLSELAKAERVAYERSTDEMVTSVPEQKRGPGRPKKNPVSAE